MQPQNDTPPYAPQPSSNEPGTLPAPAIPANEVHDYLHPIVDQPKRTYHPKAFRAILIVVVVLSLLGVGLALLATYLPTVSKRTVDTPSTTSTSTLTKTLTASEAVARMKKIFPGPLPVTHSISTPVMLKGNNFYTVVSDVAPIIGLADNIEPSKVAPLIAKLDKSLTSYGMTANVISDGKGASNYQADYSHPDVICQIGTTKTIDQNAPQLLEVRCLDTATYLDVASAQRPFYNVYSPAQATSSEVAFTGKPIITPSATPGYQLAELPVSSVANGQIVSASVRAMFYQPPSGIWYYFKDRAQKLIECEQYSTDVLKNAYVGQPCRSLSKDIDTTVPAVKKKP